MKRRPPPPESLPPVPEHLVGHWVETFVSPAEVPWVAYGEVLTVERRLETAQFLAYRRWMDARDKWIEETGITAGWGALVPFGRSVFRDVDAFRRAMTRDTGL